MVPALSLHEKKNYIPTYAGLGQGNDKWAYGISRNDDDRLSYSVDLAVAAPLWFVALDINGYTNRGWKDAWPDGSDTSVSSWYDGRYDTIELLGGFRFDLYESKVVNSWVTPKIGFLGAGDFRFVEAQNFIHRIANIQELFIDYDTKQLGEENKYTVQLGLQANVDFRLFQYQQSTITFGLQGEFLSAIGFENHENISAELRLRAKSGNTLFALSYGYWWYQGFAGWKTQDLVNDFLRGQRLGFELNAGALSIRYWHAIESTHGYTTLTFNVLDLFVDKPTWIENDIIFSYGFSYIYNSLYNTVELEKYFGDLPLSFVLRSHYVAGYPVNKKDELSADLNHVARLKRGFSLNTIGLRYDFPGDWSANWCVFYASASVGFSHYVVTELTNMLSDSAKAWTEHGNVFSPIIDAELGVKLIPGGVLKSREANYGFLLSGGVTFVGNAEEVADVINIDGINSMYPNANTDAQFWVPHFTAALQIGFDL